MALDPLLFPAGSADPADTADTGAYMDRLTGLLKDRPALRFQICGLATEGDRQALQAGQPVPKESSDSKSAQLPPIPDETLLQLAEARAAAVKRQLVEQKPNCYAGVVVEVRPLARGQRLVDR